MKTKIVAGRVGRERVVPDALEEPEKPVYRVSPDVQFKTPTKPFPVTSIAKEVLNGERKYVPAQSEQKKKGALMPAFVRNIWNALKRW